MGPLFYSYEVLNKFKSSITSCLRQYIDPQKHQPGVQPVQLMRQDKHHGPIVKFVEPRIQEEQCGFRPGRGTVDQLFTLARLLEGFWEFAQPVYMCFVDLEKAFDRVPRGFL